MKRKICFFKWIVQSFAVSTWLFLWGQRNSPEGMEQRVGSERVCLIVENSHDDDFLIEGNIGLDNPVIVRTRLGIQRI
ncbi:hypothetical protein WN51_05826 [Melipona quadrifasciata]|uniref:Uncharacterized protein n=1 Tax=Melipona quadrifasciata TaxID=166423 RepID=A0A0N0BIN6_9HYME|nr:hypothetical protein WN51_05826 [Melipona quadrifasciata]